MRWFSPSIVTAPTGTISNSDFSEVAGIKSDDFAQSESRFNIIKDAVVSDVEFYLRRAVFHQRRRYEAICHDWEAARTEFFLEPIDPGSATDSPPTIPSVTVTDMDGVVTALEHTVLPAGILLSSVWRPVRGDRLRIEFDCGFRPGELPAGLKYCILAECQHRYERVVNQAGGTPSGWLPGGQGMKLADPGELRRWRAYNEPLVVDLVEGRACP